MVFYWVMGSPTWMVPPPGAVMGANLMLGRYIVLMDNILLDHDADIVGRHGSIKLHGPAGFAGMRAAGRCAAEILDALVPHVVPGVTTGEIDEIVFAEMKARGAIPATLGYRGYTKSCCTSVNHVVCHGIPGDRALKEGDIVNIDVTPILDGWHGDTSRMYLVGDVGIKAQRLVQITCPSDCTWLASAREGMLHEVRRLLQERLGLRTAELDSFIEMVRSRLDMSITALLRDSEE